MLFKNLILKLLFVYFGCAGSALLPAGFSAQWFVLLPSLGSGCVGFSGCSGVRAQQSWPTGLVALRHVGSSRTRDRTCVHCTGSWIPNHWTTREAPNNLILILGTGCWQQQHHQCLGNSLMTARSYIVSVLQSIFK